MSGAAIRLNGVSKSFGARTVLDGLDLEAERGRNLVVMGRSGTGKSVTLKTIAGLIHADSGTVEIDGTVCDPNDRKALRRARSHMGFLFQGGALINWMTAWDNIALPLREHGVPEGEVERRVKEGLEQVGLADAAHRFPSELSGGMSKRVAFARAVVSRPSIVLYDEPTTGLDPATTRTIDKLIIRARDDLGATGVIVSHDVASALRIADHIALLDGGKLDAMLTPEQFVNSEHPLVREFLDGSRESVPGDTGAAR